MHPLLKIQLGLIAALLLLTAWFRVLPLASVVYITWLLRNAVLAGAGVQLLVLLIRSARRRSLRRGCAPVGLNLLVLAAAAAASAWFWWALAVLAAST